MSQITTIRHPRSGETYAVLLAADGTIVEAAGPLHHKDQRDEASLATWLMHNQDREEDAAWLSASLEGDRR